MEIELRAKIQNLESFLKLLKQLPGLEVKKCGSRQVDTYLRNSNDLQRKLIYRIRRQEDGAILTLKTKSVHDDDVAWHDIDIPLNEPDKLENILLNSDYVYVVMIDKIRDSFKYEEFEINVDNILDLGYFIEIESLRDNPSQEEIAASLEEMRQVLFKLGCTDQDVIKKGYVQLMEEASAK
jgi:predicted adenylyl cyclase CyaB